MGTDLHFLPKLTLFSRLMSIFAESEDPTLLNRSDEYSKRLQSSVSTRFHSIESCHRLLLVKTFL